MRTFEIMWRNPKDVLTVNTIVCMAYTSFEAEADAVKYIKYFSGVEPEILSVKEHKAQARKPKKLIGLAQLLRRLAGVA